MSAVTPGARVVSDDQIRALFATFTRAGALTGATVEHMQRIVNLIQGGDWTDAENLPGATATTVPAIGETLRTSDWDATSIVGETFGLRFSGGVHVSTARFSARVPKTWLETNTLTRLAWAVGSLANDVDSFQDIVRYPLDASQLIASDSQYNYYARNEATDRPAGAHYRLSYDTPAELDPDITVPQVPKEVSTAERTAGTEEGTRLWSPEDVKEAIDALGKSSFASLTDTPGALVADQYVRGASDGNSLVFSAASPVALGNATGRLVGRTSALPTAVVARGTNLAPNPGTGNTWSYGWTGVPSGYNGASPTTTAPNTNSPQLFFPPLNPPSDDVFGLWVVSKVGADEKHTIGPFSWGPGVLTDETSTTDTATGILLFRGGGLNDGLALASIVVKYQVSEHGFSEITLEGNGTALPANSTVELYEAVVRGEKGEPGTGGGGTSRAFVKFARPTAAVNITTPTGSAVQSTDQWSPWTEIESLPAITAAEAGTVVLAGDTNVQIATASAGGGDRFQTEIRLVRTRASVDTVLVSGSMYGPRNMPFNANNTSGSFAAATRESSGTLLWTDTAQAADVYKLEARVVSQLVSDTRDVTFRTATNGLLAFAGGGGTASVETWAQVGNTAAIPRTKQQIFIGTQTELAAETRQDGWIYITTD